MKASITRTKILSPSQRAEIVSRPRVLALLDDILDYPFTLISAPAGYGKTSLLIDYVRQADFPVCWLRLDSLDQDPSRFLDHLIACIQIQFPDFGISIAASVDSQRNPLSDLEDITGRLINELFESIDQHTIIILEDFHFIEENTQIGKFLNLLGRGQDENIHLVITSRNMITLPEVSLLIGRRMVKAIGFQELAFTPPEIQQFYLEILDQPLSDEKAGRLADETEGWITGLLLSGKYLQDDFPEQAKAAQVSGRSLFNYLAEQVFRDQTIEIQKFLLYSSIFSEFDRHLYQEVYDWPGDQEWNLLIDYLLQQNLFIHLLGDDKVWIRYHNLFLEFLRSTFWDAEPELVEKSLRKAVKVYAENAQWENAYETCLMLDDPRLTGQIIEQASPSLFHSGRITLLAGWLAQLPENIFSDNPRLYALAGFIETEQGSPVEGLMLLNKAISFQENIGQPLDISQSFTWRACANRIIGNYDEALIDANTAREISIKSKETIQYSESNREIGLAYYRLGNLDNSIIYLKESLKAYKRLLTDTNVALVFMDLGSVFVQCGEYQKAKNHYEEALKIWEISQNSRQIALLSNNLAYLSILLGNYIEAKNYLDKATSINKNYSNNRLKGLISATFGDLAKSLFLYSNALNKYNESLIFAKEANDEHLITYVLLSLASIHRILGNFELATSFLINALNYIKKNKTQGELGVWQIEKALLKIKQEELIKAQVSILKAQDIFQKSNKPVELAQSYLTKGLIELEKGNLSDATLDFSLSIDALKPAKNYYPIIPTLARFYTAFSIILNNSANPDLIKLKSITNSFLDELPGLQNKTFPDSQSVVSNDSKIHIQAFGTTGAWFGNSKITASEWIHQKTVRELFYYLLAHPEGVHKDQIGLDFWPESSPRQLTCQFKNAIYRLRRAIGKDIVKYNSETHFIT